MFVTHSFRRPDLLLFRRGRCFNRQFLYVEGDVGKATPEIDSRGRRSLYGLLTPRLLFATSPLPTSGGRIFHKKRHFGRDPLLFDAVGGLDICKAAHVVSGTLCHQCHTER